MNEWSTRTEKADMPLSCLSVTRINWRFKPVGNIDTPDFHSEEPNA